MKLKKSLNLTVSLLCLIIFSNVYGNYNGNNPYQEKENWSNKDNIFSQEHQQQSSQYSNSIFDNSPSPIENKKASADPSPPGPPDGASINNHLTIILVVGFLIIILFAKKYTRLINNKS